MENGSKIMSVLSLLVSFMEVNTDIKKALRGGYTCCVPGCYSNAKRDMELSFHKLPRDVSLREK